MMIYYYEDRKGQHGSVSEYKARAMAEQNHCEQSLKVIPIEDFRGELMGDEYN